MTAEKIQIIGIGDDGLDGLTQSARNIIDRADLIVGSSKTLSQIAATKATASVDGSLDAIVSKLESNHEKRVVLLADGDPLFYGIARYLCDRMGKDRFEVMPHVSSMQLAFARVKENWDDAYLANLATQPLNRVVEKTRTAEKVGLFTTDSSSPVDVVQSLLAQGIDYFTAYVCENLGSPDERVTKGDLADIGSQSFGPLNVMILVRKPNIPDRPANQIGSRIFGNPDHLFKQSKPKRGLLTSMEVRVIALAELDLGHRSIVWDVGAGSGAVAIEAARIASAGKVYAIEMDPDDQQLLVSNSANFHVGSNLVPILGKAPEAWHDLPEPDAIFVGGTGRAVGTIVEQAITRLRSNGRLVANVSNLDNLNSVYSNAVASGLDVSVRMINIAHSTDQLDQLRFEAMNPTFLITLIAK